MKRIFLTACIVGLLVSGADASSNQTVSEEYKYPFYNMSLSVEERVDDLVSRLTTAEKIAQMFNDAPAVERLGIPAYNWWNESLHGVARAGEATVFPQAIGLAATFDEDLMFRVASTISDEGRAKYHHFLGNDVRNIYTGITFWSPNINIFRDPRWGRGQETYGEDPYLTGRMAVNFVNGLQGDHETYLKSVATVKHYAVHSGPEKTRHSDSYTPTRRDLYETYLPAFKMAISEADVESLMCAYNAVDGQPACGNFELMEEILRGEMGFDGYVVSDCGAVADFWDRHSHGVAFSANEAAAWALKAGTDLNCGDLHGNTFANLQAALHQNLIAEADIDIAVKRLMRARFKLGMFDSQDDIPYSAIPISEVGSAENIALTQEASGKSLVLLKNDGVLPLKPGIKVAVIGPNAKNKEVLVGNYNGVPTQPVLPYEGVVNRLGETNVIYAPGSAQIGNVYTHYEVINAKSLFHKSENGKLDAGLKARYFVGKWAGNYLTEAGFEQEEDLARIDPSIDFQWTTSPIDGSLDQEFAVVWDGILQPSKSGTYAFSGSVKLKLDGQWVDKPVALSADKQYQIEARYSITHQWPTNALAPGASLTWLDQSLNLTREAIAAADRADVVIFMGGIDAHLEGEEMPLELDGFTGGDRTHIRLPAVQTDLLKELKATGKPIVMVNFSGSAMALNWEDKNLNAIIQAFYPGEKTGTALANLLWGDVNPSGRLPITFYKSVEGLPAFDDYSMENRTYKYHKNAPLYPFGHGLTYSKFTYGSLDTPDNADAKKGVSLKAVVKNISTRAGEDVVQLYASLLDTPNTPIRALKGFKRVSLEAGEEKEVTFKLSPQELTYVDQKGKMQAYKGRVLLTIGSGQKGYVSETALAEKIVTF